MGYETKIAFFSYRALISLGKYAKNPVPDSFNGEKQKLARKKW